MRKTPLLLRVQWCALFFWLYCLSLVAAEVIPVATVPPGDLAGEDIPQVILITFDDAMNPWIYERIQEISNHKNPDGSPIAFTFFVSTNYTDYYLVHRLHAEGHEIAVHTVTHSTGTGTPFLTWIREIAACRELLSRYAGIPRGQIRGFRAPFLAYNAAMFRALAELGFTYDSSIPEGPGLNSPDGANYIWPYTLHDGAQQYTWTGVGPDTSLRDLFEVPMWNLLDGETRHNMDPGGSGAYLLQLFKDNFTERYEGNRAPFGLWLHATGWLSDAERIDTLNEFLEWALAHEGVWVVGVGSLLDWMRNPVPVATASSVLSTVTYDPVPEADALSNSFSFGSFRSVGNRAVAYPTVDNAFLRPVAVSGISVRWEVAAQWTGSFQVQVVANHSLAVDLTGWKIEIPVSGATYSGGWGGPNISYTDGVVTLTPGWAGAAIAPGETVLATLSFTGTPDALGTPDGIFSASGYEEPDLFIGRGLSAGSFRLSWPRVAPIYEIESSTTLTEDSWQTVETAYGREEITVTPGNGPIFYRLKVIY